jgi:hypothetical protein
MGLGGGKVPYSSEMKDTANQMRATAAKAQQFGEEQTFTYSTPILNEIYETLMGYYPATRSSRNDPYGGYTDTGEYGTYGPGSSGYRSSVPSVLESRLFAPALERSQQQIQGFENQLAGMNLPTYTKANLLTQARRNMLHDFSSGALDIVNKLLGTMTGLAGAAPQGYSQALQGYSGAAGIYSNLSQMTQRAEQQGNALFAGGLKSLLNLVGTIGGYALGGPAGGAAAGAATNAFTGAVAPSSYSPDYFDEMINTYWPG